MPKVALADTFEDWEQLFRAAVAHGDVKNLKVHLAELRAALLRLRELEAFREHLQAQRQAATQELNRRSRRRALRLRERPPAPAGVEGGFRDGAFAGAGVGALWAGTLIVALLLRV